MDEMENRGQNASTATTGEAAAAATQETNEEVLHDDTNAFDVLKETARQLGLSDEEVAIMSKKDLQSYVDKQVTQALKTREEKLKKEEERRNLEMEGKYQELLRLERKEALEDYKNALVKANNLPDFVAPLIDVSPFADSNFSTAKQQVEEKVKEFATAFSQFLDAQLQARIKEMQKGTSTPTGRAASVTSNADLESKLKQFFNQEV